MAFVLVGGKLAGRRIAPAHVLDHYRVTVLHRLAKGGVTLQRAFLVVGSAIYQGWEVALAAGEQNVGAQDYPVAHGNRNVFLQHQVVRRCNRERSRRPQQEDRPEQPFHGKRVA
jgi:hypothetical protein